jgi:hypothetical protein
MIIMTEVIGLDGIIGIAKNLLIMNPRELKDADSYLQHLEDTYNIAEETALKVQDKYPWLKINAKEIAAAGGLHDIGRAISSDQLFHELRGAKYIEENGLELEVADSLRNVYRIVQMFRPHAFVFEQYNDTANRAAAQEFAGIDKVLLLPRTWNEAIVVYAELSNMRGQRTTVEHRLEDVRERYSKDPAFQKNPTVIKGLERSHNRIISTCARVENLAEGKIPSYLIATYGFI